MTSDSETYFDSKKLLENLPKTTHSYCGIIDENGLRTGHSCEQWRSKNSYQKYNGNFLHNNLHLHGIYFIAKNLTYFDGLFYANKLEGYGQVIYADATSFEGLFRKHYRFGPGIVTHLDNTQDVGLWDGFSLMRLSTCTMPCFLPTLGKTQRGKTKLLKFRKFVPICPSTIDNAKEILQELGANEKVMAESDQLYNLGVRCPESLFFNTKLYDESFFTQQDCTIDVVLSKEEFEEEVRQNSSFESCQSFSKGDEESEESVASSGDQCSCIDSKKDKFTELCVQLHQIEMKLEEMDAEKKKLTRKIKHCKRCCLLRYFEGNKNIQTERRHSVRIEEQVEEKEESSEPEEYELEPEEQYMHEQISDNVVEDSYTTDSNTNDNIETELSNYYLQGSSATFLPTISEPRVNEQHRNSLVTPLKNHSPSYFKNRNNSLGAESGGRPTLSMVSFGKQLYNDCLPHNMPDSFSQISLNDSVNDIPTKAEECLCGKIEINVKILEKQLTELTNDENFFEKIRQSLKEKLDIEFARIHKLSQENPKYIKKVIVSDLLAWNNEKNSIDMLQHCFRHRKSEENISFNVTSLLTGDRTKFKSTGKYESACIKFLEECSDGRDRNAFHLLRTWNINPDLCDARGNTGIFFATARDKTNVIGMLVNCGGKVDVINDEGLTPLLMTLLQFLTFKHKVVDWEKAFLLEPKFSEDELVEMKLWRPHESLLNLVEALNLTAEAKTSLPQGNRPRITSFRFSFNEIFGNVTVSLPQDDRVNEVKEKLATFGEHTNISKICVPHLLFDVKAEQKYVLDTEFKRVESIVIKKKKKPKGKKQKLKKKKNNESGTSTISGSSRGNQKFKSQSSSKLEEEQRKEKEENIQHKLENIKRTLMTLLYYGSDPNIGEVPRPALILSVFSDDPEIVTTLLENRANPDVTTPEENLTGLHIVASLKPSENNLEICRTLLKFHANSNIRTNNNHWLEVEKDLIGDELSRREVENQGKNVLHLLCLRQDFTDDCFNYLGEMAELLVRNGCNTSDFYLGHTPLSIAVLRQNLKLIEALLKPQMVDVYVVLGNNMGNVMTLPILKRFAAIMTYDQNQKVIDLLVDYNMNPLNPIDEFENVIAFIQAQTTTVQEKVVKKKKKESEKSKKKKKVKKENQIEKHLMLIKSYLKDVTRKVVFRHIQGIAVGYLYTFITENFYNDSLIDILAEMVNFEEALECLKLLFQYGRIKLDCFSYVVVSDVIRFVLHRHNPHKSWNEEEEEKVEIKIKSVPFLESKRKESKFYLPPFEIDSDTKKYKVCFECLQKKDRQLLKCPKCELVYFCSEKCNVTNNKTCTLHKCNLNFYENEKLLVEETGKQRSRLGILFEITKQIKDARIAAFELAEIEEKIAHLKFIPRSLKKKAEELKLKSAQLNFIKSQNVISDGIHYGDKENMKQDMTKQSNQRFKQQELGTEKKMQQKQTIFDKTSRNPLTSVVKKPKESFQQISTLNAQSSSNLESTRESPFIESEEENKMFVSKPRRKSQFYRPEMAPWKKFIGTTGSSNVSTSGQHVLKQMKPTQNKSRKKSVLFVKKKRGVEGFEKGVDRDSSGSLQKSKSNKERTSNSSFSLETYKYMAMKGGHSKALQKEPETGGQEEKGHGKKTKMIHNKNYFMKLLTKVFEDFNLPLLLLPYSCYKDGQVYYSMEDQPHFGQMYSKLEIPD